MTGSTRTRKSANTTDPTKPVAQAAPAAPAEGTITDILKQDRLAALRAGYAANLGVPATLAAGMSNARYSGGATIVNAITNRFYTHLDSSKNVVPPENNNLLPEKDRERCLIMLFAAGLERFPFAAHCYWGLMEGLEVKEIAEVLLLVCAYEGIDQYTTAMQWFDDVLTLLRDCPGDTPLAVVGAIKGKFPP